MNIYIKKAYDSIKWSFVEDLFTALEFPPQLIKCTKECIKKVFRFTLMLNGSNRRFLPY